MLQKLRTWICSWLFKEELDGIIKMRRDLENTVNQRVAEFVSRLDPFELVMKEFHGVFSDEFKRPEENLNEQGRIQMLMLGYRLTDDPSFKHLINWMMNTQGNATLRAPNLNRDTALDIMLYGRAQISIGILLKKEVSRLSSLYREMIGRDDADISNNVAGDE